MSINRLANPGRTLVANPTFRGAFFQRRYISAQQKPIHVQATGMNQETHVSGDRNIIEKNQAPKFNFGKGFGLGFFVGAGLTAFGLSKLYSFTEDNPNDSVSQAAREYIFKR